MTDPAPGGSAIDRGTHPAQPPTEVAQRVAASLSALDGLADRPLEEHPEAFQQVHEVLQRELADIDGS